MPIQNYNGQLRPNEVFGAIYNMIISQQVFAENIKGTYSNLADRIRTDGTLFGDTKLFYSTDILKSRAWGRDAEAENLLKINRPRDPECQSVTIDVFRQIDLTVDYYLTKRAWASEGSFASFTSVMLQWIRDTKRVYDATLVNTYFGTHETSEGKQTLTWTLPSGNTEADNRLIAQTIAEKLANLNINLKDVSRDYNDYHNLRSYDLSDFYVVWNSDWVNKIKYIDLPTIFHKDGVESFLGEPLPSRYFGKINSSATAGNATGTVRSLIEQEIQMAVGETLEDGRTATANDRMYHLFAGDSIPNGKTAPAGTSYTEDSNIICKIVHKDGVKYMSAFEVATSFFNPRSLTENHYLTWGHSEPTQLHDKPYITIKANKA